MGVMDMALKAAGELSMSKSEKENLFRELDLGIDDMECGREVALEDAFLKIEELRNARRVAKA